MLQFPPRAPQIAPAATTSSYEYTPTVSYTTSFEPVSSHTSRLEATPQPQRTAYVAPAMPYQQAAPQRTTYAPAQNAPAPRVYDHAVPLVMETGVVQDLQNMSTYSLQDDPTAGFSAAQYAQPPQRFTYDVPVVMETGVDFGVSRLVGTMPSSAPVELVAAPPPPPVELVAAPYNMPQVPSAATANQERLGQRNLMPTRLNFG